MIATQPPYSALNPDREGGILARTTLRFWIIFDGAGNIPLLIKTLHGREYERRTVLQFVVRQERCLNVQCPTKLQWARAIVKETCRSGRESQPWASPRKPIVLLPRRGHIVEASVDTRDDNIRLMLRHRIQQLVMVSVARDVDRAAIPELQNETNVAGPLNLSGARTFL